MRVVDGARGGGEGEQIVDRRGDLGGALVAVPHDPGDPARVGGAAAHDPADFLAQGADARPVGLRMVVVVDRRGAPGQVPDRDRQAALELVVIVAVEQVVLAVVLVVQYRVGGGEAGFEQAALGRPRRRRRRPTGSSRDRRRRDRRRPARCARRSGSAARRRRPPAWSRRRDSRRGARRPRGRRRRLRAPAGRRRRGRRAGWSPAARRAPRRRAPRCRTGRSGRGRRRGKSRKCAASRRPAAGRAPTAGRISKPVTRPLAPSHTGRTPMQRQRLGDVVAAGAHVGGAPGRQREPRRIVAVLLGIALDQQAGRMPAELPGRRGRHRAGVDRVEIAPGRQHLGPAAARRAARAGRDEAAVEPGQQGGDLGGAAGRHRRPQCPFDPAEHGGGAVPCRVAARRRRRPAAAPEPPAARPCRRRCASGQLRRAAGEGSGGGRACQLARPGLGGPASAGRRRDRGRRRAPAAATRPLPPRRAAPGRSPATARRALALGAGAEHVQPVADLQFLQFAQKAVELAQRGVASSPAAMPQSRSMPAARARSRISAASGATRLASPRAAS